MSSPPRSATCTSSPAGQRPSSVKRRHRGTGTRTAGPGLAAAPLPHPHFQVGSVHHFHKLGVDPLREVRRGASKAGPISSSFRLSTSGTTVTQWGLPTPMQVTLPAFALHFQRAVHQRALRPCSRQAGPRPWWCTRPFPPATAALPSGSPPCSRHRYQWPAAALRSSVGVQPLGHTADAVAAHLCLAAVRVKNAHPAVRALGGNGGADADDAVRSDGKVAAGELLRKRPTMSSGTPLVPAVEVDVIVGAALHFGKG